MHFSGRAGRRERRGLRGRRERLTLFAPLLVIALLGAGGHPAWAKEYRHASGLGFSYPATWSVTERGGVLVLTPPRPAKNAQGQPTEAYLVGMDAVGNIAAVTDPRVLARLDQTAQSLSSLLVRQGSPVTLTLPRGRGVVANEGLQLDYAATGGQGQQVRARIYACLIAGQGIAFVGFGLGPQVLGRHRELLAMLRSVNFKGAAATAAGDGATDGAGDGAGGATGGATGGASGEGKGPAATPAAGEVGNEAWGFFFRPPAGWTHRASAEGAILGHHQVAGVILVRPHQERSLAGVKAQLQKGLAEAQIALRLAGRLGRAGRHGYAGEYQGTLEGNPVRAWITGTASPHGGGGAWIFAVAAPGVYGGGLVKAAEQLGRSLRYVKLEVTSVMRALAGTWTGTTTNTSSRHVFSPDGRYSGSSESSYGGRFHNQYGDWTGSWGSAGTSRAAGRWVARGTRERGTIVITRSDGSTRTLPYRVHREKGRTYWNEYWLGGRLHGRR